MEVKRRTFIKGAVATGVLAGIGAGHSDFFFSGLKETSASQTVDRQVFQNACPRNCYDTCSMLTTVEDGVIKFVEGNPQNTYTNGNICVKGNIYPRTIYSPDRIKYPMRQNGRGRGDWERISWDEAYTEIANKVLAIKEEYGSTLPICLNKYSGSFDILRYGIEGTLASMGYHSIATGTPCWPAGIDAQTFDFGTILNSDPEQMIHAKHLILWGVNPAWNAVHSMNFIEKAKENGAKIVAIDPILTNTAGKADEYVQIKTSTDGALALGMAKYILDENLYDLEWLENNSKGYREFFSYLENNITLEWASEKTGVAVNVIEKLAREYATTKPANLWIGYGMQRHTNGGQNVRAINALAAITGNVGIKGGGANYAQLDSWGFNYHAMLMDVPEGSGGEANRPINMNNFAAEILAADEPPIKMLWIAGRNPVSQDPETTLIKKAFKEMDLVVTADLFMTETVKLSDIVLPVSTPFETPGVNVSYWHYWMTYNERAIEPLYESKSDVEIAMGLSEKMNELSPGSCTYPTSGDMEEWVGKEFNDTLLENFGLNDWTDLKKGPAKMKNKEVAWENGDFRTPSGKYEFYSEEAESFGHHPLPIYREEMQAPSEYPYRLLTPHSRFNINSQFQNLDWMEDLHNEPMVEIHPDLASEHGIKAGDLIKVYNDIGYVKAPAKITRTIRANELVMYQGWFKNHDYNVNYTVKAIPADMGAKATGMPGISFHDNFVTVTKV